MTDWICVDCLTDDNRQEGAVTLVAGNALCERHARERMARINRAIGGLG